MLELLNDQELDQLTGGAHVVTKEEYCDTMDMLIENNWNRWSDAERKSAATAYAEHC